MKRKLLNNKGFTLIEIIVATSIFSIVVGIIYLVLNSSINLAENQTKTTTGQQTVNILQIYLNDDIKNCEETIRLGNSDEYIISYSNKSDIIYKIISEEKGNKIVYNITRTIEDSESSIEIVSNLEIKSNIKPLIIQEKNNMYNVQIGYLNRTYAFDIYPRID